MRKEWKMPADPSINFFSHLIFPFICSERRFFTFHVNVNIQPHWIFSWWWLFEWKRSRILVCFGELKCVCGKCAVGKKSPRQIAIRFEIECKMTWNMRRHGVCAKRKSKSKWLWQLCLTCKHTSDKKMHRQSEAKPKFRLSMNKSNYNLLLCKCRIFVPIQWTNCQAFCGAYSQLQCDKLYHSRLLITSAECERQQTDIVSNWTDWTHANMVSCYGDTRQQLSLLSIFRYNIYLLYLFMAAHMCWVLSTGHKNRICGCKHLRWFHQWIVCSRFGLHMLSAPTRETT